MTDRFYFSKLSDPDKWDADMGEPIATFDTPERAQTAATLANQGKLVFLNLWKRIRGRVSDRRITGGD